MFTRLLDKKQLNNVVRQFLDISRDIDGRSDILLNNCFVTTDVIQKILLTKTQSGHDNIIKPIILNAAIESEMTSAGSGEICFLNTVQILDSLLEFSFDRRFELDSFLKIKNEQNKEIDAISKKGKKLQRSDLKKIIEQHVMCSGLRDILSETLQYVGPNTSIFVDRSNSRKSYIDFIPGFNFKIPVSDEFLSMGDVWYRKDVKCVVIDGIIETVGEIHHLLEKASEDKEPTIVFVRSLAEDVRSTILFNLKRGTIDLFPVEVGFDENTINVLNDIAICCGADMICSYKGDLISESTKRDMSVLPWAKISKKGIMISSKDTDKVLSHLRYLRMRRADAKHEDIRQLFDKRIRAISSNSVTIKIGTDQILKERRSIEILDRFFRILKAYSSSGLVDTKKIGSNSNIASIIEKTDNTLLMPTASLIVGLKKSISISEQILNIGSALVSD